MPDAHEFNDTGESVNQLRSFWRIPRIHNPGSSLMKIQYVGELKGSRASLPALSIRSQDRMPNLSRLFSFTVTSVSHLARCLGRDAR